MLPKKGGEMNKQEVKNIVDGMPDGMSVDDYLVEVVNRAIFVEREACVRMLQIEADRRGLTDTAAVLINMVQQIRDRGRT
jgi:hypothetical protein